MKYLEVPTLQKQLRTSSDVKHGSGIFIFLVMINDSIITVINLFLCILHCIVGYSHINPKYILSHNPMGLHGLPQG
jgi:hypothetical protein